MELLTPSSPGGLPTLSLTTNSSWLPWGKVAMPLISPVVPVPHGRTVCQIETVYEPQVFVSLTAKDVLHNFISKFTQTKQPLCKNV